MMKKKGKKNTHDLMVINAKGKQTARLFFFFFLRGSGVFWTKDYDGWD